MIRRFLKPFSFNKKILHIPSNKMSVPAAGLPNQGLRKEHNAMIWRYTKNNIPRGVLLTSCHRQLSTPLNAGLDINSTLFVSLFTVYWIH